MHPAPSPACAKGNARLNGQAGQVVAVEAALDMRDAPQAPAPQRVVRRQQRARHLPCAAARSRSARSARGPMQGQRHNGCHRYARRKPPLRSALGPLAKPRRKTPPAKLQRCSTVPADTPACSPAINQEKIQVSQAVAGEARLLRRRWTAAACLQSRTSAAHPSRLHTRSMDWHTQQHHTQLCPYGFSTSKQC